jgi:hypothetical protein
MALAFGKVTRETDPSRTRSIMFAAQLTPFLAEICFCKSSALALYCLLVSVSHKAIIMLRKIFSNSLQPQQRDRKRRARRS